MNLNNEFDVEYEVIVEGRRVGKYGSYVLAEASLVSLDENAKGKAQIVPVTKGGKQVLLS